MRATSNSGARVRGPRSATLPGTATQLVVGMVALAAAAVAGLAFVHRPWPNRLDVLGYRLFPEDSSSRWGHDVVHLGSLRALLIGVAVVFVIGLTRDWVRAFACAAAPIVAVLVVQDLAKPLVGRHLGLGGPSSFPSGTVAAVASLATALVLVVPAVIRPVLALAGAAVVAAACAGVVILRWHYPTDALGGVLVGTGAVLTVDALFHLPWAVANGIRPGRAGRSAPSAGPSANRTPVAPGRRPRLA